MPTSWVALLVLSRSHVRSRVDLQLENLALRHQIGGLQRSLKKTPGNNRNGPPLLGFSVAYMARLALGISHRHAANGCGSAWAFACFGLGRFGRDSQDAPRLPLFAGIRSDANSRPTQRTNLLSKRK